MSSTSVTCAVSARGSTMRILQLDAGVLAEQRFVLRPPAFIAAKITGRRFDPTVDVLELKPRVGWNNVSWIPRLVQEDGGWSFRTVALPPVREWQILGTEVLLEFIGSSDGTAAPRLAQFRQDTADLPDLWRQLVDALSMMARAGWAHGDLSAYNLLVHDGRLVVIDLPQIVDVVANPQGRDFLARDANNVATWFGARGVTEANGDALAAELRFLAGLR